MPYPFADVAEYPLPRVPPTGCPRLGVLRRSAELWYRGEFEESLRMAAAVAADAECEKCEGTCGKFVRFWYVSQLVRLRELHGAQQVLNTLDVRGTDPQVLALRSVVGVARGNLHLAKGDIERAVSEATRSLRPTMAPPTNVCHFIPYDAQPGAYCVLALSALRRSDMRQAARFAGRLSDYALLWRAAHMPGPGAWAVAQVAAAQNGLVEAEHLVSGIITNPPILHDLLASEPGASAWLVRSSLRLGSVDLARISAGAAYDLVAGEGFTFPVHHASALHALGVLEKDPQRIGRAIDIYPDVWAAASARPRGRRSPAPSSPSPNS
jgi:hypothetical protein